MFCCFLCLRKKKIVPELAKNLNDNDPCREGSAPTMQPLREIGRLVMLCQLAASFKIKDDQRR